MAERIDTDPDNERVRHQACSAVHGTNQREHAVADLRGGAHLARGVPCTVERDDCIELPSLQTEQGQDWLQTEPDEEEDGQAEGSLVRDSLRILAATLKVTDESQTLDTDADCAPTVQ